MATCWRRRGRYAHTCRTIDPEIARRLAQTADHVADIWRQPDSCIWEVRSEPQHFTQSKMLCATALEPAAPLADLGALPSRHVARWRAEALAVRDFVELNCWCEDAGAYVRSAGSTGLACSFWLVEGQARTGRCARATALTSDRRRRKALGYVLHFAVGQLFAFGYLGLFVVIGHSGWLLGAVFGLTHGLFSITALVNVLLPVVHPRMGSTYTAAGSSPLLEPPGFLMRNYGARTPEITIAAHIAYGVLVGGLISLAA